MYSHITHIVSNNTIKLSKWRIYPIFTCLLCYHISRAFGLKWEVLRVTPLYSRYLGWGLNIVFHTHMHRLYLRFFPSTIDYEVIDLVSFSSVSHKWMQVQSACCTWDRWKISIPSPLKGAHLHEGTCTLGDCCVKVIIIFSHMFSNWS
jgi:hypothetical protein